MSAFNLADARWPVAGTFVHTEGSEMMERVQREFTDVEATVRKADFHGHKIGSDRVKPYISQDRVSMTAFQSLSKRMISNPSGRKENQTQSTAKGRVSVSNSPGINSGKLVSNPSGIKARQVRPGVEFPQNMRRCVIHKISNIQGPVR